MEPVASTSKEKSSSDSDQTFEDLNEKGRPDDEDNYQIIDLYDEEINGSKPVYVQYKNVKDGVEILETIKFVGGELVESDINEIDYEEIESIILSSQLFERENEELKKQGKEEIKKSMERIRERLKNLGTGIEEVEEDEEDKNVLKSFLVKSELPKRTNQMPAKFLAFFNKSEEMKFSALNLNFNPSYFKGSDKEILSSLARNVFHNQCVEAICSLLQATNPNGSVVNMEAKTRAEATMIKSCIKNLYPTELDLGNFLPDILYCTEETSQQTVFIGDTEFDIQEGRGRRVVKIEFTTGSDDVLESKEEKYKSISQGEDYIVVQYLRGRVTLRKKGPAFIENILKSRILLQILGQARMEYTDLVREQLLTLDKGEHKIHEMLLLTSGALLINIRDILEGKEVSNLFNPREVTQEEVNEARSSFTKMVNSKRDPEMVSLGVLKALNNFKEYLKNNENGFELKGRGIKPWEVETPFTKNLQEEARRLYRERQVPIYKPGVLQTDKVKTVGKTSFGEDIREEVLTIPLEDVQGERIRFKLIMYFARTTGLVNSPDPIVKECLRICEKGIVNKTINAKEFPYLMKFFGVGEKNREKSFTTSNICLTWEKGCMKQLSEACKLRNDHILERESPVLAPVIDREIFCKETLKTKTSLGLDILDAIALKTECLETLKARCWSNFAKALAGHLKRRSLSVIALPVYSLEWIETCLKTIPIGKEGFYRKRETLEGTVIDQRTVALMGFCVMRPLPGNNDNNPIVVLAFTIMKKEHTKVDRVFRKEGNSYLRACAEPCEYCFNVQLLIKKPYEILSLANQSFAQNAIANDIERNYLDSKVGTKTSESPGVYSVLNYLDKLEKDTGFFKTTAFWTWTQCCNAGPKLEAMNSFRITKSPLIDNQFAGMDGDVSLVAQEGLQQIFTNYTCDSLIKDCKELVKQLKQRGYITVLEWFPGSGGPFDKAWNEREDKSDLKELAMTKGYKEKIGKLLGEDPEEFVKRYLKKQKDFVDFRAAEGKPIK